MPGNFPQYNQNSLKNNIPPNNQNIPKNNFIPNIIPMQNNIPEPMEPIDNQDMQTEILNISKIKEGFYIGDKISAISLDVIIQFKITHMINATGNQITNQWEAIGISYLTLNWTETPNQILFDPKDEIANRIVEFIDNSYLVGEGVLAHSFRGCDRVCIVVVIYLMKKYKWSLNKSIEYLKSKKQDVDIPIYFFEQLQKFETRMKLRKELTIDTPWEFEGLKDPEEKIMRNTYLNGFKPQIPNEPKKEKDKFRHIMWADINSYQKCPIEVTNTENDLFFKKDIKPIFVHMQMKPKKGCIKGVNKINNNDVINNNINNNLVNNLNSNLGNNLNRGNFNRGEFKNNNFEDEKNEKISYNNFLQQKGNKRNPEQQLNDFKNILNKNFNLNNEPMIQKNENEKKDKSPLRNWLNKERNNNNINKENKYAFDFVANKEINDIQNIKNNNIRTNNSMNLPKSNPINQMNQMNMESLISGLNLNKNGIKDFNNNNNINNMNNMNNVNNMNNKIINTTNYFKMNNNEPNPNTNVNVSIPFSTHNSMNINHKS